MTHLEERSTRPEGRQGTPAFVARFEGVQEARTAMKALENHGVDGADLVLVGPRPTRQQMVRQREARGVVVRKRLFYGRGRRTRRHTEERETPRHYLAVDEGVGSRIVAWRVRPELFAKASRKSM